MTPLKCAAMRGWLLAAALLLLSSSAANGARFVVLPAPSSNISLTASWRLANELSGRGHAVLYATSSADAEAVQTLQREQHGASGSVQPQVELWMPYTGPSPLNAPAHNKPGKHTSAAATLPGIDAAKAAKWGETQKWVHAVRMWLAANCEPLLGADSQLAAALNAFKPTHVIGDSAFVCFSHLADALGNLPRLALANTLMPPFEQIFYGISQSILEVPVFRTGLPRDLGLTQAIPQIKGHLQLAGPLKRTMRDLDSLARTKYNITLGLSAKDPAAELPERLRSTVQAFIIGQDPLLTALPEQLPAHAHVVGPAIQPVAAADAAAAFTQPTLLLHVESWRAGAPALSAVLDALQPVIQGGTSKVSVRLLGAAPPQPLADRLNAAQPSTLATISEGVPMEALHTPGAAEHVLAVICDASPLVVQHASLAGIPIVALPAQGDQLDQAARVHELGTTVVLAPPGSALAASKSALLGKPATGTNPQGDPQVVRAAIARVTGIAELQQINGGSSQDAQLYRAAAAAVAAALASRTRHPIQAAADAVEMSIGRHAAAQQLSANAGQQRASALLQRGVTGGEGVAGAGGGNLLVTTAFATGFIFMLFSSLLTHYFKKWAAPAAAGEAKPAHASATTAVADGANSDATQLRKRR